jgi:hypothetical protein
MSYDLDQKQAGRTAKFTRAFAALMLLWAGAAAADTDPQRLPIVPLVSTTIANGELNPYGVAFVPASFHEGGPLEPGDVLVSNFNNSANVQGTGSTIVKVTRQGKTSLFFNGTPGLGLTTALGVLREGFVLVGSLPIPAGSCPPPVPGRGSILVVDRNGQLVQTLDHPELLLNGPWDLTIHDEGERAKVFVSNVLDGTVTRLDLVISSQGVTVQHATQIASGYAFRCDPAAVVLGPTGLAYDARRDLLYVASTADNKVFAVMNAGKSKQSHGTGGVIYQDQTHLHGPLGLVLAPSGHLIVSNGDAVNADPKQPSEIVEFTPAGKFIGQLLLDPNPDGAFGIALAAHGDDDSLRFAAVNDNTNTVSVWTLHVPDSQR